MLSAGQWQSGMPLHAFVRPGSGEQFQGVTVNVPRYHTGNPADGIVRDKWEMKPDGKDWRVQLNPGDRFLDMKAAYVHGVTFTARLGDGRDEDLWSPHHGSQVPVEKK